MFERIKELLGFTEEEKKKPKGSWLRLLGFEGHVDGFYPRKLLKAKGYVVEPQVALDVPPANYENEANRVIRARELRGYVVVVVQMRDRVVRSAYKVLDALSDIL